MRWTVGCLTFSIGWEGPSCETEAFPERTTVMSKKITIKAGSKRSNEPRLVGSIIEEMLQGWNRNTELAVDLKTILRSDRSMKTGKEYQGVLRRDQDASIEDFRCRDAHFTFVETLPWSRKRNPRLFNGKFISITRQDDGTLRPNFKPIKVDRDFSAYRYALGVFNELMWALEDLVEK